MNEIKVFTATDCTNCLRVKDYLKKAGIEFTEHNVTESREAAEELNGMGYISVPVVTCGGKAVSGFYPPKLDELLTFCLQPAD